MSEQTRWTLAKASELALTSSERIRRSLELLGPRRGAAIRRVSENGSGSGARAATASARRSVPPPSGA